MSSKHAGPSSYKPKNQATAPPKPAAGKVEVASSGKSLGHPHERVDKGKGLGKGFGKIKSTGIPRHERFASR